MANLGELRTLIADDLVDSRLTASQINRAINDAINFYEKKEFYFNLKNYVISPVAGKEYYGVNDNAAIPDMVRINYVKSTSPVYLLLPVQDSDIAARQNGTVTGTPAAFSYVNQTLRLFPIPNGSNNLRVQAVAKYATLTGDNSSNDFTTEAEELIRQSAKRRLALNILHDVELAQRVTPMEQEAYDALLAEGRRRDPQQVMRVSPELAGGLQEDVFV